MLAFKTNILSVLPVGVETGCDMYMYQDLPYETNPLRNKSVTCSEVKVSRHVRWDTILQPRHTGRLLSQKIFCPESAVLHIIAISSLRR